VRTLAIILAAGPVLLAQPVAAQNAQPQTAAAPELQIFRDTDPAMTCVQISDEAAELSSTMGGSQGGGVFGALGGVVRSGAAMLIPGAGLAMAGADVVTQPERDREQARRLAVQNRWYYLNGLYTGLRCNQAQPAAEPSPPRPPPAR
jgi:hypothetical protein